MRVWLLFLLMSCLLPLGCAQRNCWCVALTYQFPVTKLGADTSITVKFTDEGRQLDVKLNKKD